MPGLEPTALANLERATSTSAIHVEDINLYLPSELSAADRKRYCPDDLDKDEDRLRYAEACDALEELRHWLRQRLFTNTFKKANVTGQIRNTKARESQARIDDKVHGAELHYNRARAALVQLRGKGDWEEMLRVLNKSDVRALNERELTAKEKDDRRRVRLLAGRNTEDIEDELEEEVERARGAVVGEGQKRPSWIWYSGDAIESISDPSTIKGMSFNGLFT